MIKYIQSGQIWHLEIEKELLLIVYSGLGPEEVKIDDREFIIETNSYMGHWPNGAKIDDVYCHIQDVNLRFEINDETRRLLFTLTIY